MQNILKKSAITLAATLGTAAAVAQPFTSQQPGSIEGPWYRTPLPPMPAMAPAQPLYQGQIPQTINQECERIAPMMQHRAKNPVFFYISQDNTYACGYQKVAPNAPYTSLRGYLLPREQRTLERDMKQYGIPTTPLEKAMMDACNSMTSQAQPIRTDGRGTTIKSAAENGITGCVWDYKNGHRLEGAFNLYTPDGKNRFDSILSSNAKAEQSMINITRQREQRIVPRGPQ